MIDYHLTEVLLAIYIAQDPTDLQNCFPPLKVSDCPNRHILFLQIRLFRSLEGKQGNFKRVLTRKTLEDKSLEGLHMFSYE